MRPASTVVVTGGAGFIGSRAGAPAARRAAERVVDRRQPGQRHAARTSQRRARRPRHVWSRATSATCDALAPRAATGAAPCITWRASAYGTRCTPPRENHDVNAHRHAAPVWQRPRRPACRASSTCRARRCTALRGAGADDRGPSSDVPCTVYGASKLAGECYARRYHDTYGYPTWSSARSTPTARASHHEGDSGEVIPKLSPAPPGRPPLIVFGDGTQTRDFTYVGDTAARHPAGARASRRVGRDDQPRQRRRDEPSTSSPPRWSRVDGRDACRSSTTARAPGRRAAALRRHAQGASACSASRRGRAGDGLRGCSRGIARSR